MRRPPSAFFFASALDRQSRAGNGELMTERTATETHPQAKRKSTDAKPGRRTAARAGAGTKRTAERKKTPAKATAKKPRPASENVQSGAGGDAGIPNSKGAKRGLADLKEQARNMVEKDAQKILKGLKQKARKGSANDFKLLVDLAGLTKQKPAANPDGESRSAVLQDLMSEPEYQEPEYQEPEYQEPAENWGHTGSPQPGDFPPARGAAEEPPESGNETA